MKIPFSIAKQLQKIVKQLHIQYWAYLILKGIYSGNNPQIQHKFKLISPLEYLNSIVPWHSLFKEILKD